ncbi:MAG: hypothetical protein RLZZ242_365 [Bacteroidota bacterium]|jgi:pyridoxal phosphate enzyme (YggS family)
MSISDSLTAVKQSIPDQVTLVAVSKTKPNALILEAYQAGHRDFGENKVQELVLKQQTLPKDIQWHMIGHLQRNKVKYIVDFVHLIHSVDTKRLLDEIQKQAQKINRRVSVLLQIHIAQEENKFGLDAEELKDILSNKITYSHINFKGLMGMATFTTDTSLISQEFAFLQALYERFKEYFDQPSVLSSGMSADYPIALKNGSTMIRIGSAIFGHR